MTDTGQPPKRAFEPPPWEMEQFEELARKRAEEARSDAAVDELAALSDPFAPERPDEEEPDEDEEAGEPGTGAQPVPEDGQERPPAVDERRVNAMLLQLSGEETPAIRPIQKASKVLAGIAVAVGVAIVVIAAFIGVQSAASGPLAATSAGVGAILGGGLMGVGVWLWVRARR